MPPLTARSRFFDEFRGDFPLGQAATWRSAAFADLGKPGQGARRKRHPDPQPAQENCGRREDDLHHLRCSKGDKA